MGKELKIQPAFSEIQPAFSEIQPAFSEIQPAFSEIQPAFFKKQAGFLFFHIDGCRFPLHYGKISLLKEIFKERKSSIPTCFYIQQSQNSITFAKSNSNSEVKEIKPSQNAPSNVPRGHEFMGDSGTSVHPSHQDPGNQGTTDAPPIDHSSKEFGQYGSTPIKAFRGKKRRNPFAEGFHSSKKHLGQDVLLLVLGAFCQAFAYSVFIAPAGIVPGGVYGISITVNHLTKGVLDFFPEGFPIGVFSLFLNIPLFLLASRRLGLKSGGKTIATFSLIAVFTDLFTNYVTHGKAIVEHDPFLSAVYGGAILGVGVYLTFRVGSTSAGTDVLARIIAKGKNIRVSNLIIAIDSLVVLFGLLAFKDLEVPLYSLVTIFVYGKFVDLLSPENPNKAVFIVSQKPDDLRDIIVNQLGLTATIFKGKGMYKGTERELIFMIVERKYLPKLKKLVLEQDPEAFIATTNATNDTLPPMI